MLKKIFIFSFCIFLSSCGTSEPLSTPPTPEIPPAKIETFESNYARILRSTLSMNASGMLSHLNSWYDTFYPSGYDTSLVRVAFNIPKKTSGDISISADAARETYRKFSAKMSLTGAVTDTSGKTIEFRDVRGQLVANTEKSRYYGLLEALDIAGLPDSTLKDLEEIKTYMGKWWVLDYIDMMSSSLANDVSLGGDFGNFITGYTAFIQDFVKNGTDTILPLLEKTPIIIPTSSGSIVGTEYVYPITVSSKGITELAESISLQYSGTGISENIMSEIKKNLSGITSVGELRVSTKDPIYFSLKLTLSASGSSDTPIHIQVQSIPENFIVKAEYMSGSLSSTYTHKDGERSRYILSLTNGEKTKNIIEYAGIFKPENIDANIVFFDPNSESTTSASLQYQKSDGAFAYAMNQSRGEKFLDIINISGVYGSGKLTALTGTFTLPDLPKDTLSLGYERSEDDSFTLEIKTPSGNLDGDGSLKKNHIKVNLQAKGFSVSFEHKKNEDGSWEGKLQLPVGLIGWNGKIEEEILTDFHIKGTSPFAGLDIDLTKKDDTVTGPYILSIQGSETSSGMMTLRKIPKNFDIRLDTTFVGMDTPSFFEFHNFTDLRWDKDAKVIEPENAESLSPIIQKSLEKTQKYTPLPNPISSNNTPIGDLEFTDL